MSKRVVWKYVCETQDAGSAVAEWTFEVPAGGQILHVGVQSGEPVVWMLVDPSARSEARSFFAEGTGRMFETEPDMDRHAEYVGTAQIGGLLGELVLHLFEWKQVDPF